MGTSGSTSLNRRVRIIWRTGHARPLLAFVAIDQILIHEAGCQCKEPDHWRVKCNTLQCRHILSSKSLLFAQKCVQANTREFHQSPTGGSPREFHQSQVDHIHTRTHTHTHTHTQRACQVFHYHDWCHHVTVRVAAMHTRATGGAFLSGIVSMTEEYHESISRILMMTSSNGNIFRVTGPLCGEFTGHRWNPRTRPVTRSFDVFFDLRLDKCFSEQPRRRWFETPSSSWRHCNARALCARKPIVGASLLPLINWNLGMDK